MMAGRYIDHLSIIQSIWMTKTAYTWFSNSWMYVYCYIVSSHLTDIIQRGWQLYEFHMLQSLQNIDKNTKMTWPRRDLNTQPSDLESDALPLRHGVHIQDQSLMQYQFSSQKPIILSKINIAATSLSYASRTLASFQNTMSVVGWLFKKPDSV